MVSTRRSKRIQARHSDDEDIVEEDVSTSRNDDDDDDHDDDDDDDAPAEEASTTPDKGKNSKNSKKKQAAKARKNKKKEAMKSKATGVGLKISIDEIPAKNKKIVFGDDKEAEDEPVEEENEAENDDDDNEEDKEDAEENDTDGDDAIEEVSGSKAREELLEQMNAEEKFATKSKKKRKTRERKQVDEVKSDDEDDDDDDEFDEDFFAELEAAKAEEQKELAKTERRGKHTTFVVSQDEDDMDTTPREVDDNIQVVVLKTKNPLQDSTANAIAAVPTNKLSQQAILFSRGNLANGSDGVARGATGQKRKWQVDNTWKRSKKMKNMVRVNRGGSGSSSSSRSRSSSRSSSRRGKSLAPTNFVKKR